MSTIESSHAKTSLAWSPINILMYHDIALKARSSSHDHGYVVKRDFETQIRSLIRSGYTPISVQSCNDALNGNFSLPERPFVITFDDGYESLYHSVHPFLSALNIPYTVFLVSELIGKRNEWILSEGIKPEPLLNWSQIVSMAQYRGVSFQSHTATHVHLADTDQNEIQAELANSKDTLEQRLGTQIDTICYPYGSVNSIVVQIAKEVGYKIGLTTEFGRVRSHDDVFRLPRVAIHHVPWLSTKFGLRWPNFWWRIRSRIDRRQ